MKTDNQPYNDFLEMLEECNGIIMEVCMLYTDRDPANIKSLYQDIVCDLWEGYPGFRHRSKASSWVHRVAVNTALMGIRHDSRRPQLERLPDGMYEDIAATDDDWMTQRLYALIDRLDDCDKELVALYLSRKPQQLIARELHISPPAVRKRIERIKRKLKELNEND